jgi:hypothetical protein
MRFIALKIKRSFTRLTPLAVSPIAFQAHFDRTIAG